MAVMMAGLYEALKAANVPDDKAIRAAEEAAGYDNRITKFEGDLRGEVSRLRAEVNVLSTRVTELAGKVALTHWMLGTVRVLCFAILGLVGRLVLR